MSRFTRIAAVCAATASLAAAGAAPASASDSNIDEAIYCNGQITVPSCVNYALDVANRAVEYVQTTYDTTVQPQVDYAACTAIYLATGRRCS
jgi:putative intracellular protease/amidase